MMDVVPSSSASDALPWYQVWLNALTRPNPATYEDFVSRAGISSGKAYLWVFLAAIGGWALAAPLFLLIGFPGFSDPRTAEVLGNTSSLALALACLIPLAGAMSIVGLIISTGISHLIARALGGVGTFTQLIYAVAAYTAPASLITPALSMVPLVNCLASLLGFYTLFLNIVAIKAVHRLTWGRAFLSSSLMIALVVGFFACVFAVAVILFGGFAASGSTG